MIRISVVRVQSSHCQSFLTGQVLIFSMHIFDLYSHGERQRSESCKHSLVGIVSVLRCFVSLVSKKFVGKLCEGKDTLTLHCPSTKHWYDVVM